MVLEKWNHNSSTSTIDDNNYINGKTTTLTKHQIDNNININVEILGVLGVGRKSLIGISSSCMKKK